MPLIPASSEPAVAARLRAAGCVFAEDEARLLVSTAAGPAELAAMVERRAAGVPLEQVLGWAEFCGLRIAVAAGVFVPRRRTEFLVSQAIALATAARSATNRTATNRTATSRSTGSSLVIVDLCCGSGAIAAALAAAVEGAEVHAADIDPAAVACARRNLPAGRVHQGDLFGALPAALRGRVTILTANVPYVPTGGLALLPAEARLHESRVALDGGPDGLSVLRRVAAEARNWLAPGGHLLTETSERQAPLAAAVVTRERLTSQVSRSETLAATVITGTLPGTQGRRVSARPG